MAESSRRRRLKRQVNVRFDERLYKLLERDAEQNGRTVAQTVRHRVKESLASA